MDFSKYKNGFSVRPDDVSKDWMNETWTLNNNKSSDGELHFDGYDANFMPFPEWNKFKASNDWHQKRIQTCKEFTSDFDGLVYMDKVCVSKL